jgi:4-amino-4-deoxy-L-arabinose transferase-like glycosyltransferase
MLNKKSLAYFAVVCIITIAGLMRISAIASDVALTNDSLERYEPIANNLVAGRGFSKSLEPPYVADSFEQPAYPYFIAAIYWLTAGSRKTVVIAQVLLELATVMLVFQISILLGLSRRAQILALSLAALSPFLPLFSRNILTEMLATFFITLTYYLALLAMRKKNLAIWLSAAVAGGLCLLTRPDLIIAVSLLPLAIALLGQEWNWQQKAYRIILFALIVCAVLVPWTLRNYLTFQTFSPLGQVAGQTKQEYARWLNTWLDDPRYLESYWWHALDKNYSADFNVSRLGEEERKKATNALAMAKEQGDFEGQPAQEFAALVEQSRQQRPFLIYFVVPLQRTAKTLFFLPAYVKNRWLKTAAYLFWSLLLLVAAFGMFNALRKKKLLILTLCALLAGRLILPMVSALAVEPRYMLEALPALFILAGSLVDYRSALIQEVFIKTNQEQIAGI